MTLSTTGHRNFAYLDNVIIMAPSYNRAREHILTVIRDFSITFSYQFQEIEPDSITGDSISRPTLVNYFTIGFTTYKKMAQATNVDSSHKQ